MNRNAMNWTVIVSSRNAALRMNTGRWITDCFGGAASPMFIEGAESIFAAYNKGIELSSGSRYVCFAHEDIDVISLNVEAMETMLDNPETGFVGAAGARRLPENACWWDHGNAPAELLLSGVAGHQKREQRGIARWRNIYGPFGPVEVLDGVILFCRRSLLDELRWDESSFGGWDFYDISITWEASRRGFINRTFDGIEFYHWGLGELRSGWEENRRRFLEWKRLRERLPVPG